jgi:hypothetical protein
MAPLSPTGPQRTCSPRGTTGGHLQEGEQSSGANALNRGGEGAASGVARGMTVSEDIAMAEHLCTCSASPLRCKC